MAERRVPAQRYDFPDEDVGIVVERFRDLLTSRSFLTQGDYVEEFEEQFAGLVGTSHAVAVSSGTAALEAILRSIDVADSEVVVPTNTFAATAFAVLHAGARVVFADCGDDMNLDPADVEQRLTDSTRAVITVHIGGLVSPSIVALRDICHSRGIALIEDAAHAHGSSFDGKSAGSIGDAGAFSFFSTKVMTTGEGGMVVTDREDIASTVRLLRDQAKVAGKNLHEVPGYNWRMTEFQAIVGLAQLGRLREFISERKRVAEIYDELLGRDGTGLEPLPIPPGAESNYYKYLVLVEGHDIGVLGTQLAENFGVKLGGFVYDVPLHQQPAFSASATDSLPRAEHLCSHHICPPIYPSLTTDDARYVASALVEVVS